MNGAVLCTYNTTCPQWPFKWRLGDITSTSASNSSSIARYRVNHNVRSLASSSSSSSEAEIGAIDDLKRALLEQVDKELSKGDDRAALSLVKDLQSKPGGLRGFGAAQQVGFAGGFSSLVLDTIGHNISQKYHNRVIQHEAGHFLIAYLLGILPKGYTLSGLEAFQREGSLNVQAGTVFVDFEFTEQISEGRVTATMLNKFSCIALAGVATEYLLYGYAEGGLADVKTLDGLLSSLGFTQKKADSQVRWAVLNTIIILRRHEQARTLLAKAMSEGKSVGSCIDVIEKNIDETNI